MRERALHFCEKCSIWSRQLSYLERSSNAENPVICFFWWETLERFLHSVVLFWDQVIGSVHVSCQLYILPQHIVAAPQSPLSRCIILQSDLSVARGLTVPLSQWHHPSLQPRPFQDEVPKVRLRHVYGKEFEGGNKSEDRAVAIDATSDIDVDGKVFAKSLPCLRHDSYTATHHFPHPAAGNGAFCTASHIPSPRMISANSDIP